MTVNKTRAFPVAEIFGPTVQGEGVDQGVPAHFVRFGGCDFKCDWCDTPHAVLPSEVRKLPRLNAAQIVQAVEELTIEETRTPWVVLSGGNPCLYDLKCVVWSLQRCGYWVAVETQGTSFPQWLRYADRICLSPKPPSSGMPTNDPGAVGEDFIQHVIQMDIHKYRQSLSPDWFFFKVVIFDEMDFEWAEQLFQRIRPEVQCLFYLSACNDAGASVGNPTRKDTRSLTRVRNNLLDDSKWLTDKVLRSPILGRDPRVRVQSQYHVLLWGNEKGR